MTILLLRRRENNRAIVAADNQGAEKERAADEALGMDSSMVRREEETDNIPWTPPVDTAWDFLSNALGHMLAGLVGRNASPESLLPSIPSHRSPIVLRCTFRSALSPSNAQADEVDVVGCWSTILARGEEQKRCESI